MGVKEGPMHCISSRSLCLALALQEVIPAPVAPAPLPAAARPLLLGSSLGNLSQAVAPHCDMPPSPESCKVAPPASGEAEQAEQAAQAHFANFRQKSVKGDFCPGAECAQQRGDMGVGASFCFRERYPGT